MACLLIDVGSTFIKYSVYDEISKNVLLVDAVPFPGAKINNGKRFSVSLSKIKECIYNIFEKSKQYCCSKVFFSVQMHGFILRDLYNGFSDYVSWRDKSGDTGDPRFREIDFNQMGTSLKSNLPLVKLAFKNCEGEFFTLGSYIAWWLTGNNATHVSDACASGFFFSDTGKRNKCAVNLKMPSAHMQVEPIGNYENIVVYTPVGDQQVSFLGSGAAYENYLLNVGTATQIACLYEANYPNGKYERRPYFDKNILYTISGLVGGDKIYEGKNYEELFSQIGDAIKKLPPKKGIIIGGGRGKQFYSFLSERLEKIGLKCSLAEINIGMEGLKMIADSQRIKVGTMLSEVCFSNFPIIAKNSGLDFIIVDDEHGYFDYADIAQLTVKANLIGLDLIVRIGDSSRGHITKLADMGVTGFLLPMTNTQEDIRKVIRYATYPPIGERGVSTTRAHTLYNPPPLLDYMITANQKMKIYAQIETVSGVNNIDQILSVPEVCGIFIGPNDLSVDMCCVGDKSELIRVIEKIATCANFVNKPFGIITGDKVLIKASIDNNVSMISVGSELNMLINGCKKTREDVFNGEKHLN